MLLKMTYVDVRIILSKKDGIYDKDFFENFYSISIHRIFIAKMKSQRERNRKEMQEMLRNANIFIKINPSFFFITYVLKLHHLVDCIWL